MKSWIFYHLFKQFSNVCYERNSYYHQGIPKHKDKPQVINLVFEYKKNNGIVLR